MNLLFLFTSASLNELSLLTKDACDRNHTIPNEYHFTNQTFFDSIILCSSSKDRSLIHWQILLFTEVVRSLKDNIQSVGRNLRHLESSSYELRVWIRAINLDFHECLAHFRNCSYLAPEYIKRWIFLMQWHHVLHPGKLWRQKPRVAIMTLKNVHGLRPVGINSPVPLCISVKAFLCLVEAGVKIQYGWGNPLTR